jgi:hypothetical protein
MVEGMRPLCHKPENPATPVKWNAGLNWLGCDWSQSMNPIVRKEPSPGVSIPIIMWSILGMIETHESYNLALVKR